jgi:D-alanine-D-alanine ligase
MAHKKMTIGLLAGGKSGEREVSLSGAAICAEALDTTRFDVRRYDPATDLAALVHDAHLLDFVFILLHGRFGEDGSVQGLLDLLGVAYQGAGILGSALAMDKHVAKTLYQSADIPVAPWRTIRRGDEVDGAGIAAEFGLPMVIKPVREGSSLGLTIAGTVDQILAGIEQALAIDERVMVERYVSGREITVGVLGNSVPEPLPVIEIIPGDDYEFFDYNAKYLPGASQEICPADISDELRDAAQRYAVAAHQVLELTGYSRTDMIIDEDNRIVVLETNTIPGMTQTSLFPQAAQAYGLDYGAMLERLIELGLEAHGEQQKRA